MARLPVPGGDNNQWGDVLNDYLSQAHNTDGSLKRSAVEAANPAASSISFTPTGVVTATNLQAAMSQVELLLPDQTKSIPIWDTATFNAFSDWTITADGVTATRSVVNRKARVTNTNTPTSSLTNMRHWYVDESFPATNSEVTTLFWGEDGKFGNTAGGFQPGNVHRAQNNAGTVKGFIAWPDIVFGQPYVINIGLWEGTGSSLTLGSTNTNFTATGLINTLVVTNSSRTSMVVTLTVPASHGVVAGDSLNVDLTDNTFDTLGVIVSSVTPTTITYTQTGTSQPDTSGATGTCYSTNYIYPFWMTTRLIDNTLHVKVWRYNQGESDWADSTRAFSWTYSAGTVTPTTGDGACGILAGHIGNTRFLEFGHTTFTKLS